MTLSSCLETHKKQTTFIFHFRLPSIMFKSKAKQKRPETMEETFSLILRGCRLAKDLESDLGNLANQPEILFKSCEDIIKVFATAKERLNSQDPALFAHLLREPQNSSSQQQLQSDPSLQEWLKYGGVITQAMDLIQQQLLAGKTPLEINQMGGKNLLEGSASARLKGSVEGQIQVMDVSDSGRGSSSSSQRPRRRKDDEEKYTVTVPAPQMGNTDLPPDDNYTWRKYGQKEILGSRFPRAYYRCTHQKMYQCPAKKQVQRLDNDFNSFEVTYIGKHTCHMSSTAPSITPPPAVLEISRQDQMMMTQAMVTQPTPTSSSSAPMRRWVSVEFSLGSGSGSGGSGSGGAAGGSTTGSRYGRDVDYPAVADLADVMFNSGSSSSNSMDFIFPFVEDKWEAGAGGGAGDKKN